MGHGRKAKTNTRGRTLITWRRWMRPGQPHSRQTDLRVRRRTRTLRVQPLQVWERRHDTAPSGTAGGAADDRWTDARCDDRCDADLRGTCASPSSSSSSKSMRSFLLQSCALFSPRHWCLHCYRCCCCCPLDRDCGVNSPGEGSLLPDEGGRRRCSPVLPHTAQTSPHLHSVIQVSFWTTLALRRGAHSYSRHGRTRLAC